MIKLKDEEKRKLIKEIEYFFSEEFDLDLGIVGSDNIYDFIMENFAKIIYNKGLEDGKKWLDKIWEDISIDYTLLYK